MSLWLLVVRDVVSLLVLSCWTFVARLFLVCFVVFFSGVFVCCLELHRVVPVCCRIWLFSGFYVEFWLVLIFVCWFVLIVCLFLVTYVFCVEEGMGGFLVFAHLVACCGVL